MRFHWLILKMIFIQSVFSTFYHSDNYYWLGKSLATRGCIAFLLPSSHYMKIMQLSTPQNGRCVYVYSTVWKFKNFSAIQILCEINHSEFRVINYHFTELKLISQKMMTGKFVNFHTVCMLLFMLQAKKLCQSKYFQCIWEKIHSLQCCQLKFEKIFVKMAPLIANQ